MMHEENTLLVMLRHEYLVVGAEAVSIVKRVHISWGAGPAASGRVGGARQQDRHALNKLAWRR